MKKKYNIIILFIFLSNIIFAQVSEQLPLFPNGIPNNPVKYDSGERTVDSVVSPLSLSKQNRVISNISEPTYSLYPAATSNNKHIGVVIFPGGGLVNVWLDKEGTDLALWLSSKGISCMVVKYRTNTKDNKGKFNIDFGDYKGAIYQDARTAILKMKDLSDSLGIDKDKIGILGFSAGGWLSERIAFKSLEGEFDWKPAFVGLIYHGDKLKAYKQLKNKQSLPPFFMAVARDDKKLPLTEVIPFLSAIALDVNKSELHIYSKGDHGFGLGYDKGHSVETWKNSFYNWLLDVNSK